MALARVCIHNNGLDCTEEKCNTRCGWNPRGRKARKKQIETKGLTMREDGICRLVLKKGAANGKSR